MTRDHHYSERLLTLKNVNLSYGDKVILRDINIGIDNVIRPGVNQGQVVALLGPSGIGKTQLFRCIAGLQRPTTGDVLIGTKQEPVHAGSVGVVQQSYPLLQHRTIQGNLELVCSDRPKIKTLLERFGLESHANKYPIQLSGGQRQRIAIIQQMLQTNHFLLMDEPFSGLDIIAKDKVCGLINEVSSVDELNTTIFTTHDLESSVAIADHIWLLGHEAGKPGATIVKEFDLIKRGLAWDANIQQNPAYWPTVHEVREAFMLL